MLTLNQCLMMLHKNAIPPHVGIKNTINQGFPKDLAERNVHIAFSKTPFRSKAGRRRKIFLNNFSAAGGNTGVLLEEGPVFAPATVDPRSDHIVTVTAKSKSALVRNIERLTQYIELNPKTSIADLSYTTTARRIQHNWRASVTGSDISQIKMDLMSKRLDENFVPVPPTTPKVAFLFTGQGSHYSAMGKELYETSSVFKNSINEFEKIVQIHGLPSFVSLIDGSSAEVDHLSPVVVQLALVSFEMAIARLWGSWGITPSVVLGHSLGEYAALNVAGVLSVSDTLFLVGKRAQLLVEKCTAGTHAMLAVQESNIAIKEKIAGNSAINIACINGPRETVLGGNIEDISNLADQLSQAGIKCTRLKVPFAFHTGQVEPILDDFERIAGSVRFSKEKIPIISSLLGRMSSAPFNAEYLRRHAREPVNFLGGLIAAQGAAFIDEKTVWLEVGPHPVCLGMVKATFGVATIGSPTLRRNEGVYRTISRSLSTLHNAGLGLDWNEYHRDFTSSLRLLDLPAYSFDDKNYWIQYDGDWCLTKGRIQAKPAIVEEIPRLSTSSVHKITSEVIKGDEVSISAESDMARADLRGVVSGHLVNGVMLCPSVSLQLPTALTVSLNLTNAFDSLCMPTWQ
jgi:acyl transferase domain-containing protein